MEKLFLVDGLIENIKIITIDDFYIYNKIVNRCS
jgi:2-C-methyl-D-erythritol 4-phosphate cytidylyltransferase